jgi:predicted TIM-barrel fold metal-dependent hydrolase
MTDTLVATNRGREVVEQLGIRLFDADNHYYEPPDCFTRYLPADRAREAFRWLTNERGQYRLIVNGEILRMIVNPRFDESAHMARPGGLTEMFRSGGDIVHRSASQAVDSLGDRPEYQHRDARLQVMDDQLVERNWLFPTIGVIIEEYFRNQPKATAELMTAFNRWLEEDWGFAYKDRIHAVPHLSLADINSAVAELEWVLSRGAKLVDLRSCPVPGAATGRSLADPEFNPFWARVNEAEIPVTLHAGDLGGTRRFSTDWGENPNPTPYESSRFQMMQSYRSAYDTAAALIFHGLFDRYPKVRIVYVEQGASWTGFFLANLKKTLRRVDNSRLATRLDPIETFRKHFWFEPYPEENLGQVIDVLGEDRVVFGSDWPHVEGTREPAAFFDNVQGLSATTLKKIMRDNALSLMGPQS